MDRIVRRVSHFSNIFIVEEAESVAQLQSWLINLTPENFEATKENILHSIFAETKERVSQLARNVFLIGECRPILIPLLCDLCDTLAKAMADKSNLKGHFLRALSMPPTRHSAHLFILRQLMYRMSISADDVVRELNRFLNSHPDRIEDMLSTFCVFAPEIEKLNKPLFDSILTQFRAMCEKVYLPPELTLFIEILESLRANNWKLLIGRADFGFNSEPVCVAIKDDDVSTLIGMSKNPSFNKNQRVHPSVFERCMFLWNEPTLVQFAAFHGAVKCFKYLIQEGADINIRAHNNYTTLSFAIAGGQMEIIKLLLEMNVDPTGSLQTAALMHQNAIFYWLFETLYKKSNAELSAIDPSLGSVLHAAASANNTELMLFSLAHGVDVNIADRTGLRPLHHATEKTRMDAIRLLLAHTRMDINARDENDETALHVAAQNGRYNPMRLMVQHPMLDVNAPDKFCRTPLHFGAQEGYSKAIKVLLAHPAIEINAPDIDHATPLHYAAHNGRRDAIKILCAEQNILVNVRDMKKWVPLHYAAQGGFAQTVRYLVAHPDIEVNSQTEDGWTPLHLAIQEGHLSIVEILLAHRNIDVNASQNNGWTPLHAAILSHSLKITKALLKHPGIDCTAKYNGVSAYDLAVREGDQELAKLVAACIEEKAKAV